MNTLDKLNNEMRDIAVCIIAQLTAKLKRHPKEMTAEDFITLAEKIESRERLGEHNITLANELEYVLKLDRDAYLYDNRVRYYKEMEADINREASVYYLPTKDQITNWILED